MKIRIFSSADELARATATLMAVRSARAIVERGLANIALAGGATPQPIYRALGVDPLLSIMPWQACHFFWSDERVVPFEHQDSNFGQARQALLGQAPLKSGQLHPMPVESYEPEEAAARYQAELRTHFGGLLPQFDFMLLGMGQDGHVASLFARDPAVVGERLWVAAVDPPSAVAPSVQRITLTMPVINNARTVVIAVTGAGKSQAVARALSEETMENNGDIVARGVRNYGELFWFLDKDAAADL